MRLLEYLFGRRKTTAELLRENRRLLNRAIRELDRETRRMEAQEQQAILEIKRNARQGQIVTVRSMAKNLVRSRQYRKKFIIMRATIQAVALKVQGMRSQDTIAQAMCGVTRAMQSMNCQLNLPYIQQMMREFERQFEVIELKEDEVVEDVTGNMNEEVEAETVVQQILNELGIQMGEQLSSLPRPVKMLDEGANIKEQIKPNSIAVTVPSGSVVEADLQARLDKLRC